MEKGPALRHLAAPLARLRHPRPVADPSPVLSNRAFWSRPLADEQLRERTEYLERCLAAPSRRPGQAARALLLTGMKLIMRGHLPEGRRYLEGSLELAREAHHTRFYAHWLLTGEPRLRWLEKAWEEARLPRCPWLALELGQPARCRALMGSLILPSEERQVLEALLEGSSPVALERFMVRHVRWEFTPLEKRRYWPFDYLRWGYVRHRLFLPWEGPRAVLEFLKDPRASPPAPR